MIIPKISIKDIVQSKAKTNPSSTIVSHLLVTSSYHTNIPIFRFLFTLYPLISPSFDGGKTRSQRHAATPPSTSRPAHWAPPLRRLPQDVELRHAVQRSQRRHRDLPGKLGGLQRSFPVFPQGFLGTSNVSKTCVSQYALCNVLQKIFTKKQHERSSGEWKMMVVSHGFSRVGRIIRVMEMGILKNTVGYRWIQNLESFTVSQRFPREQFSQEFVLMVV